METRDAYAASHDRKEVGFAASPMPNDPQGPVACARMSISQMRLQSWKSQLHLYPALVADPRTQLRAVKLNFTVQHSIQGNRIVAMNKIEITARHPLFLRDVALVESIDCSST